MKIKVLVISNSKGCLGPILTAVDKEKPDVIIHLGGGVADLVDLNFSGKIYAVRSGGEFGKKLPTMTKLNFDKQVIVATHGDGLSFVKDKQEIVDMAITQGATIMLFGNSDTPEYFEQNEIKFVAPGAIFNRKTATYAIVELQAEGGAPEITHHKLLD